MVVNGISAQGHATLWRLSGPSDIGPNEAADALLRRRWFGSKTIGDRRS